MYWTGSSGAGGSGFYRDFVSVSLGDENIQTSPWEKSKGEIMAGVRLNAVSRTIKSLHPIAFSFPGMPSRVSATKNQVAASI